MNLQHGCWGQPAGASSTPLSTRHRNAMTTPAPIQAPPRALPAGTARTLYLGYYAFILLGVNASAIGPALPAFAERTGASLAQVGLLFTPFALGYATSVLIMGPISARSGTRALLLAGATCLVISLTLLTLGRSLMLIYLGAYLLGLGQSGTQVGYNALVGLLAGDKAARTLNRLNAFFGIGALSGPLLVALGYSVLGDGSLAFGASLFMSVPLWVAAWRRHEQQPAEKRLLSDETGKMTFSDVLRQPVLWVLGITASIYVSAEVTFSGWAAAYAERSAGVGPAESALMVTVFFAAFTAGRYAADAVARFVSPSVIVTAAIGVSALGVLKMIAGAQVFAINLIGAATVGFAFGPIYPIFLSYGIRLFPRHATLATGFLTSAAAVATLVVPSAVGVLMAEQGARAGWWAVLGLIVALLGAWLTLSRRLARQLPVQQRK
ncbi:MAG: MFS transporter [Anaerolineae bacterium]|nr:MFS transporter [Thermoflexales bacterium]MDW8407106.1 MFS transporter [Anaerolineae bacterium]